MTDKQFKDYERLLPEMATLAGLIIQPLPDDPLFSTADFDPRHDDADCFKLICGLPMGMLYTNRANLHSPEKFYCETEGEFGDIQVYDDDPHDAICLCAMAWIEGEK